MEAFLWEGRRGSRRPYDTPRSKVLYVITDYRIVSVGKAKFDVMVRALDPSVFFQGLQRNDHATYLIL